MQKSIWKITCICVSALFLTGCANVTKLTEQEQEIIAEYAAGVLLRYDEGYNAQYEKDVMLEAKAQAQENMEKNKNKKSAEPAATKKEKEKPSKEPKESAALQETATPEPAQPSVEAEVPTPVPEATDNENRMTPYDMGKLFGIEGVEVNYAGFEALDRYPAVSDEQLAFTMDAAQGTKLVVLKFELVNRAETAKTCNIVGQNIKFQLRFNNADFVGVQKTLLTDDFSSLNCILQPEEARQVVIISQVAAGYETTINSVDLIARIGGENTLIKLK